MKRIFGSKKLMFLFLSNLTVLSIGGGIFPILPLYAAEFGATPTMIGMNYSIMSVASVVGTFVTSKLVQHVSPRKLFIAGGFLGIGALMWLAVAAAFWHVVVATSVIWFCGAIVIPLVGVFTGMLADEESRGKSFTLMYLAYPLGALIGGVVVSQIVDWQGYAAMFVGLAAVWSVLPVIGAFALKDVSAPQAEEKKAEHSSSKAGFGLNFYLLLAAFLLSTVAGGAARMGTSFSMQALDFSAAQVASTATISGFVAIPFTFIIGSLADRFGHKRFLAISYLLVAAGAGTLMVSTQLWQFWLAATLLMIAFCVNFAVASAFTSAILSPEVRSRGLPWINALEAVANIASFAATGYLIDTANPNVVYVIASGLAAAAILQLTQIKHRRVIKDSGMFTPSPAAGD